MAQSFCDLRVWRDGMNLAIEVYRQTAEFPKHELFGLTQQMRRAAVSVPSNIAEGKGRWSAKEFRQFLFNARGSLLELQTQIMIAQELEYLSEEQGQSTLKLASQVGRSLSGLINSLSETAA
jgi:four helix bundle protein